MRGSCTLAGTHDTCAMVALPAVMLPVYNKQPEPPEKTSVT